jgi:molybdopterin-binding protein
LIEIAKGIVITAVITKSSAKLLGLNKCAQAYAVIKASNVLLATD